MKIAISARGLALDYGGVKEYIRNLILHIVTIDDSNQFYIYYSSNTNPLSISNNQVTEIFLPHVPKIFWDHILLPVQLFRDKIDVALFPKGTIPIATHCKTVVTMHDLAYFIPHLRAYRKLDSFYMKLLMPLSAHRSDAILASSENTRKDIVRFIPRIPPKKITTIYLAAGYSKSKDNKDVRKRFGLGEQPYIFFSSSISARKNIERTIRAIALIKDKLPHNFVITGGTSWGNNRIDEILDHSNIQHRFFKLGHVDSDILPHLYKNADLYIMPSLYEGFSLTLLEAMQEGCPVVASNVSSHPEVVGDAAVMFNPYSVEDMAAAILRVAVEPVLKADLRSKGFERVKKFSWERCAKETLEVIERVGNA